MSEAITRLNAALEGRYRIESELGEGGMATVYLAEDIKHGRKVALKVLKPELAAVVGAERFLAEIKTTANLQHPHILPLFDSGEADSYVFYVMPYVEGESLRDRLDREHQLPVDDAVALASKVAGALQHAHEHGIIHRDIEPGNILLQDGEPVVADFGIALAVGAAGSNRLTETGLSLGTPYYMSPEQATGDQAVGASTDTYALGSVLYEMLVGEPPYGGSTAQAVLGKIISGKPVSAMEERPTVSANVDAAIRKALEKLPADRFAQAGDFAQALADPGFRHGELVGAGAGVAARWNVLTIGLAVTTLAFGAIAGWSLFQPERPQPVQRLVSPFLPGQEPVINLSGQFDISDDGSMLVYLGPGGQLWVRRWQDLAASPIDGTEGARRVTLSPDGTRIAFSVLGDQVSVLALSGGSARHIVQGRWPFWGPDDYIYVSVPEGTVRMRAEGGSPEPVTHRGEAEVGEHIITDLLPGGEGVLVIVGSEAESWVVAGHVRTGEMERLMPGRRAYYASTGHLVVLTGTGDVIVRLGHTLGAGGATRMAVQSWDSTVAELEPLPGRHPLGLHRGRGRPWQRERLDQRATRRPDDSARR